MRLLDTYHRAMRHRIAWSGGRSATRLVRGRNIHVYDFDGNGTGPDLVLMHGLASSAHTWLPIVSALRQNFRRIWLPDLPGHGFSALAPGESPLDVRGHAELFEEFLTDVVQAPSVVVGNSLGGAIVLRAAIARPSTVAGVGLLAPAGAPLGDDGLASIRNSFAGATTRGTFETMGRMLHKRPLAAWLIAGELGELFRQPPVQKVLEATDPNDALLPEELAALPMPITFVWGASERLLPASGWDYYTSHLPKHARVVRLERAGHLPMVERPRQVTGLLNDLGREATGFLAKRSTTH